MNIFYENIRSKPKLAKFMIYFFLIFFGFCSFPIPMPTYEHFSLVYSVIMPIYLYTWIAQIFYALFPSKPLKVLLSTFFLNGLGLLGRIALEWGEYSMTLALTPFNIIFFITAIPLVTFIIYLLTIYWNNKKSN